MTEKTKAYLAVILVGLIYGTSYLVIRIGVMYCPPFLFSAIRQLIAALILTAVALAMVKKTDLSRKNLIHQAIMGFLLITLNNGLITWSEQYITSGIAAIIGSLMPICAVFINFVIAKEEKINSFIITGMVIGCAGVGLIFKDDITDITSNSYLYGVLACFIATVAWAAGSIFHKRRSSKVNPLFDTGLQLLFGSIFLFILSSLSDDYNDLNLIHPSVLWSMAYLIIIGSVVAYSAYMFALTKLHVGIVTLYTYFTPIVAVLLGFFVLDERISLSTILATCSIVTGVYLVNYGFRKLRNKVAG